MGRLGRTRLPAPWRAALLALAAAAPASAQAQDCAALPDCAALMRPACLAEFNDALTRRGAGAEALSAPIAPSASCADDRRAYQECVERHAACAPEPPRSRESVGRAAPDLADLVQIGLLVLLCVGGGLIILRQQRNKAQLDENTALLERISGRDDVSPERRRRAQEALPRIEKEGETDPRDRRNLTKLRRNDVEGFKTGARALLAADARKVEAQHKAAAEARRALARKARDYGDLAAPFDAAFAREIYAKAVALDPEDVAAAMGLATLLIDAKAFADAEPLLRRVAEDASAAPIDRIWALLGQGDSLTARGALDAAAALYAQAEAAARAALDAAPGDPELERALAGAYERVGDALKAEGRIGPARERYEESLALRERLARAPDAAPQIRFDLGVSHERLGDVAVAEGDLTAAQAHYGRKFEIIAALAEADPQNAFWKRDLAVAHEKLGDAFLATNRVEQARAEFEARLALSEALLAADPANATRQRDLAIALSRLGDVLLREGRRHEARERFEDSLKMREALAQKDPSNVEWRRDVAVMRERLGDLHLTKGRIASAEAAFEGAAALFQALREQDPDHTLRARDYAVILEKLGDVAMAQRKFEAAQERFQESLALRQGLVDAEPGQGAGQGPGRYDLSVSHEKLGDALIAAEKPEAASAHVDAALSLRRALVEEDPSNAHWSRALSVSQDRKGDERAAAGRMEEARALYEASLTRRAALSAAAPEDALRRRDLITSYSKMAQIDAAGRMAWLRKAIAEAAPLMAAGALPQSQTRLVEEMKALVAEMTGGAS